MRKRILVVDDEESIQASLKAVLEDEGFQVATVSSGEEALRRFEAEAFDLVLLDVWLPGADGIETLKSLREKEASLKVIMISGHGNVETAVRATRLGAYDFIEKPISLDKLVLSINNALAFKELEEVHQALCEELEKGEEIIGQSPAMVSLKEMIKRVAPSDSWVLIRGENGTGKELVARTIHRLSPRWDSPFVAVNCAAIPDELIESELFGYERGAFTGALVRKKGKFELAHQGTLFMDEIGDMSLKTQAKILRTLEECSFERLGGTQTISVDVRLIAATNKDLEQEIERGNFRPDLYYRISVIPLFLPPLRERKGDIALFVEHFLSKFCGQQGKEPKKVEPAALDCLLSYPWPGNVRELKNILERLVIMTPGSTITLVDIPLPIRGEELQAPAAAAQELKEARRHFERTFILEKLNQHGWNITRTARALNIQRSYLHYKIKTLGIDINCKGGN